MKKCAEHGPVECCDRGTPLPEREFSLLAKGQLQMQFGTDSLGADSILTLTVIQHLF
jgi:hypothetical protein